MEEKGRKKKIGEGFLSDFRSWIADGYITSINDFVSTKLMEACVEQGW